MMFAENGIPKTLQCDNGTQLTSTEFRQLAKQYGFEIVTSSPYYPRGHAFVKRQIKNGQKDHPKVQRDKGGYRPGPIGTANNAPEFQHSTTS